ncbi:MAG: hypothetical protein EU548_09965 [Promethearchaeota archaeon]|nr:MAG: hypothetical protein EU548_09965 [Candidatus Lokiarchaeota archaeon]
MKDKLDLKETAIDFKLDVQDIVLAIAELLLDGVQHGIIDRQNGIFKHYREDKYNQIIGKYFSKKIFLEDIANSLGLSYPSIVSWTKALITSGKIEGIINEKEGYFVPYDEIVDTERKLQMTGDEVANKIINSFDIIQGLIVISEYCKRAELVRNIRKQLKQILEIIENNFPDFKPYENMKSWYQNLSAYDKDSYILETTANNLEYNVIQWLKDIEAVSVNNSKMYMDAFEATADQAAQIEKELENTKSTIKKIESTYSSRIANVLLIIHKESGLCIYNYKFGPGELDPDLLSGFLSAIQSFGIELSSSDQAEMRRLSYKDFEIYIDEDELIRVALIGKGIITEHLERLLSDFIKKFSGNYTRALEKFTGNIKIFSDADLIVEKTFKIEKQPEPI